MKLYMDDMRKLSELEMEEATEEQSMEFAVQSTGLVEACNQISFQVMDSY